jgi:hypothetical protein
MSDGDHLDELRKFGQQLEVFQGNLEIQYERFRRNERLTRVFGELFKLGAPRLQFEWQKLADIVCPPGWAPQDPDHPWDEIYRLANAYVDRMEIDAKVAALSSNLREVKPPAGPKKGRGRQKGVNYRKNALAELVVRLKENREVDIPAIARAVGCTPENLTQSKKFMKIYEWLTKEMSRIRRGSKKDGVADAEDRGDANI